jgi:hypothetical protein
MVKQQQPGYRLIAQEHWCSLHRRLNSHRIVNAKVGWGFEKAAQRGKRKLVLWGQCLFERIASHRKTPVPNTIAARTVEKRCLRCVDNKYSWTTGSRWPMQSRQVGIPTHTIHIPYMPSIMGLYRTLFNVFMHICVTRHRRMAASGDGAISRVPYVKIIVNFFSRAVMDGRWGWRHIGS